MEDAARDSSQREYGIKSSSRENAPEEWILLKDRDENNNSIIQQRSDELLQDLVPGSQSSRKSTREQGSKQAWAHDQTSLEAARGSITSNELKSPETIVFSISSEISRLDNYEIFPRGSTSENQDGIQRSPG
jgi:hypothetical protein